MPGETLLVIDDSPTILKVVQLVLSKAGFHITTAPDGEQGLAAARETRPDLILLDFVMPRMNGYQVCRALAVDPELKDIPVILMSAKGDQVGERFVKVMGIVDYITKPFSPEAITAVVQHTVSKYGPAGTAEEDPPSLVTGEDLAATDEADRAQARSTALAQLRTAITEVLAAQGGLSEPGVADDKATAEAALISRIAAAALDDATLSRVLGARSEERRVGRGAR